MRFYYLPAPVIDLFIIEKGLFLESIRTWDNPKLRKDVQGDDQPGVSNNFRKDGSGLGELRTTLLDVFMKLLCNIRNIMPDDLSISVSSYAPSYFR